MSPSQDSPVPATMFVMAYNQETHVRAAVASALAQDYPSLEVVLSDDASTDNTFAIMTEMAKSYDGPHRVVLNRNPRNLGICRHINHIVALSSGELIVQNTGDDVSDPDRVSTLMAAWCAADRRPLTVYSPAKIIDPAGVETKVTRRGRLTAETATTEEILANGIVTLGATCAWSRKLFEQFGPLPDGLLVEDLLTTFRSSMAGGVTFVDKPLLGWRTGGLSWRGRRSPGHEALFGTELTYARWRLRSYQAVRDELKRDRPAEAARLTEICEQKIKRFERRIALAEARFGGRLAGLLAALRARDASAVKEAIKYLLAPLYIAYLNLRSRLRAS